MDRIEFDEFQPSAMNNERQQHRKRSFSSNNMRKRDRNDLICVVCHAPAIGYNFDQITCESCKAFFRRNALNNGKKLKCRMGTNDCSVTIETRKKCKYCRLKKCFDKGLRKEWIMSEEEKRLKKQKIEDNRRLRAISQSLSVLSTCSQSPTTMSNDGKGQRSVLSSSNEFVDDDSNDFKSLFSDHQLVFLTKIEEHYRQAVELNVSVIPGYENPCLRHLNGIVDLLNEPAQICALRMITFFKLTPEFNCLHEDDRLILVKHNLITVLYIHFCICTNTETQIFHEPFTSKDFCYHASELRSYSDEIYHRAMELAKEVQLITSNDHLMMKLTILTLIFSKGADSNEPYLIEPSKVYQAQNKFLSVLWNYITVRFGEENATSIYSRLIFACLKAYSIARDSKEEIAKKNVQTDELAPLMQSVLQISP